MSNLVLLYEVLSKMLVPFAAVAVIGGGTWAALLTLQDKPCPVMHRTPTYVCYGPSNPKVHVTIVDDPYDWSKHDDDLR